MIEIQEKKLWRAGGYPTWEVYCRQVAGLSKSYAHRIINATRVVKEIAEGLQELPIGNSDNTTVSPVSESQVRPLLRLPEPGQKIAAWVTAVERANNNQPTAAEVSEVVLEILQPDGALDKPPTRSQQRADLVSRLKKAIRLQKSWEQVEKLVTELETLI